MFGRIDEGRRVLEAADTMYDLQGELLSIVERARAVLDREERIARETETSNEIHHIRIQAERWLTVVRAVALDASDETVRQLESLAERLSKPEPEAKNE